MSKKVSLKVTVEFHCENMISDEYFKKEFNSNPKKFYKWISDGFKESPESFANKSKVLKVEVVN